MGTADASIDIRRTPAPLLCPDHGRPLLISDRACPACDGAGTLPRAGEAWEDYCPACLGGGLVTWCPECGREENVTLAEGERQ